MVSIMAIVGEGTKKLINTFSDTCIRMNMEDKDKIIRGVYYDADAGFGSINDTYQQAKKILNSVRCNDVKEFLERQKSRETKPYRGFNSYIAHEPLQEIHIDLGIFTDSAPDNNGFKYAPVVIHVFY